MAPNFECDCPLKDHFTILLNMLILKRFGYDIMMVLVTWFKYLSSQITTLVFTHVMPYIPYITLI